MHTDIHPKFLLITSLRVGNVGLYEENNIGQYRQVDGTSLHTVVWQVELFVARRLPVVEGAILASPSHPSHR